jgi:hypothetical protein
MFSSSAGGKKAPPQEMVQVGMDGLGYLVHEVHSC